MAMGRGRPEQGVASARGAGSARLVRPRSVGGGGGDDGETADFGVDWCRGGCWRRSDLSSPLFSCRRPPTLSRLLPGSSFWWSRVLSMSTTTTTTPTSSFPAPVCHAHGRRATIAEVQAPAHSVPGSSSPCTAAGRTPRAGESDPAQPLSVSQGSVIEPNMQAAMPRQETPYLAPARFTCIHLSLS